MTDLRSPSRDHELADFLESYSGPGAVLVVTDDAGTAEAGAGESTVPELPGRQLSTLPVASVETALPELRSTSAAPDSFGLACFLGSCLFTLLEQDEQVACLQAAAQALGDAGVLVIEAFVPEPELLRPSRNLLLRGMDHTAVHLVATIADLKTQRLQTQQVTLDPDGKPRLRPVEHRYCWPPELDLMAQLAGLRLLDRYEDVRRTPFTRRSRTHVSVYGRRD